MTRFEIGSAVQCSDGPCGRLLSLVVDPLAGAVTHLIVEPEHRFGLGRLVPIALVDASADAISLTSTVAQFEALDVAEAAQFVNGAGSEWGIDGQVMQWPYYALDHGDTALHADFGGNDPDLISYDKLPPGEVSVRRGDRVHAVDGEIGQVQGLIIDPRNNRVSHVLLQEGHFFGRKEVAIPTANVKSVEDGIQLNLTKDQIKDLPAVGVN
jgi:sporulation protein YlmC with PRC-barrel domain